MVAFYRSDVIYLFGLHRSNDKKFCCTALVRERCRSFDLRSFGAAFGLLQNQKIFFILIAILICIMIAYVLYRIPPERKYIPFNFLLVLIASGAAGNMVDRTMHAYVIDFIYFSLIDFPVFNVADIYVTISTILLVLFILFYYKEQDFSFLSIKQQKKTRKIN